MVDASVGGSSTIYNNNWLEQHNFSYLSNGTTLSGFKPVSTALTAPTSVEWFAFAFMGFYDGPGPFFNTRTNPGFEGVASLAQTPLPATLPLMLGGLVAGRWLVSRMRRKATKPMLA